MLSTRFMARALAGPASIYRRASYDLTGVVGRREVSHCPNTLVDFAFLFGLPSVNEVTFVLCHYDFSTGEIYRT